MRRSEPNTSVHSSKGRLVVTRVAEAVAQVVAVCHEQFRSDPCPEAFEEAELRVRETMNALACELLGAVIEKRDDGASRIERDGQSWFRVAATPRTIMTSLGPLTYRRARYRTSTAPAHGGLPGAVTAAIYSTVLARPSRSGPTRFRYAGESQSLSRRRARADAEEGVPARFRIHAIPETDMHDPERDIRDIPLSQLELSPDNVRKTPADDSAFTELKASIAAHGLLENLIAHAMGLGADGIGRYAVIAGGRRLAAMQALAAEGTLDEDHPVPCRMIGDIVTAEEVSLAENSVRAAMHPADQVEAFRRLADAGSTAAAIAARFGVSERTVEKRLRLGNAAPVLLEAYRAGEIDLDTLMAFAVTTNQARQSAVWETVSQQGYRPGAWQIKRLLTEDRVPATSAIVRFVGIEAYEATGGKIDRDLFAEEDERGIWFDDPDLLNKLAIDSLQVAARELETRWKWAEARLDVDWSATAAFGRVRPQPAEPTDGEKAEIERLRTRNDELANMDDDGWTEELVEEADANETRLDEIEATIEARAVYRREDIAIAGCIATVGNDGELKLIQGLVRPEDMPARESNDANMAGQDDTGDGESASSSIEAPTLAAPLASLGDAEAEARKEAGVGIGLADDLRAIRTAIVKSQLACDFEAAFDLLLFQLARGVFASGYHDDALDIRATETPDRPAMRVNDDAFGTINVGEKHLEIDRATQKLDWTGLSDTEAFAELRALPERDKRTLFASCVARTLKGQLAFEPKARPEVEATVARLDIDFAAAVRGNRDQLWTADLLWSRLRKDRILAVARETLGETWAQAEAKHKKADIAKAMQDAFAHGGDVPAGVTAEGRAAAIAWTPPGFRAFDTGAVDDSALADDEGTTAPEPQPSKIDTPLENALEHSSVDPSGADGEARQDDATEADALPGDDPEPTPVEATRPINVSVPGIVESIDAPAVAERRAAAIASAMNADATLPVAASAPEVAGPPAADAGGHDVSVEREQVLAPPRGNGHDNGAELLEIPAFLRRG